MSNTPDIRFKGFAEPWEQRVLCTIADVRDGTHDSPQYLCEGHPFITSKNVGGGYINYDDIQYISDEDFEEINKRSKVDIHDILMGMIGTIGNIALVRENPDFAIKNVALIKYTKAVDYLYLYHYLQSDNVIRQLNNGMDGGTQKFIALNKIRNLIIAVPKSDEQQEIGNFLDQLDQLITLHQRKCDEMSELKKFMLQKMFPKNGEQFPEIRFNGFTDPWEQRKFPEVFDFLQNNTLSRAELNYDKGVAKNVHYGDVLVKFGEYLDVSKAMLPYITAQYVVDKYKGSLLKDGDVVMADTAEDETAGKCTEIAESQGFPTISGLHTIPMRPKRRFATGYLGYYMNSGAYHNQLLPLMQGIKVTSVSKGVIQNTDVSYPVDVAEQALIGQYFIHIDNIITLHRRKCDELKNIKKYMLQNMFPKKG